MSRNRTLLMLGVPPGSPYAFRKRPDGRLATLEDGGGGGPPPDPRLVQAQIEGIGKQNSLIDTLISQSNALQPLQMQQMQQAIDAQNTAMQQAQEDRAWTLGRRDELTTAQNQLIDTSNQYNSGAMGLQLGNQALADVNQSFANASGQINRNLGRMGVGPNSGQSSATNASLAAQQALAQATALNKTRAAARQEGIGLNTAVINSLSGYPALATGDSTTAAGLGLQGLNAANAGAQGLTAGTTAALQGAANMTNSATGAYNGQANYASSGVDNTGAMIGAAGGIAAAVI